MSCVLRLLYGENYTPFTSKEKKEEHDPYETSRNAFFRKVKNPWGNLVDSLITHHAFGGKIKLEKRLSPVMYGIKEIKNPSKNGIFSITFEELNKVDSPFLRISNVYIEHSTPIKSLIYCGTNIHPILLKTKYVINGRSMSLIPTAGYPCCFSGDTTGSISVEVITKDMQNDDITLHVEYVQATACEKGLCQDRNKSKLVNSLMYVAKNMTHSCNATYVHKCYLQNVFMLGCIIAVKDNKPCTTPCSSIMAYVSKPMEGGKDKSQFREIINSTSGIFARSLFDRDPVDILIENGYTCYALPFTSDSMHTTFNKEKYLSMGAISLQTIKDEGGDLVIEADFGRKPEYPPVFVAVLAGNTSFYI